MDPQTMAMMGLMGPAGAQMLYDPESLATAAAQRGSPPIMPKKGGAEGGNLADRLSKLGSLGAALQTQAPIAPNIPNPASPGSPNMGFNAPNMQQIMQTILSQNMGRTTPPMSLAQALGGTGRGY